MTTNRDGTINVTEAARIHNVSRETVYKWIDEGLLSNVAPPGKFTRLLKREVVNFMRPRKGRPFKKGRNHVGKD